MIICRKHKLVYLAPPKTGSTAIMDLLLSRRMGGEQIGKPEFAHHDVVWDDEYQDWYIFMSVRSPYRRMISMWQYTNKTIGKGRRRRPPNFFDTIFKTNDRSFNAFMQSEVVYECSQNIWRCGWQLEQLPRPVDLILKQENLATDLKKVPGLERENIRWSNVSRPLKFPWHVHYTKESIDKVKSWFTEDFIQFGYNTDFDACVQGNYLL